MADLWCSSISDAKLAVVLGCDRANAIAAATAAAVVAAANVKDCVGSFSI